MRCPVCGRDNLTGARFCANCGAALQAASFDASLQAGQTMDNGQYRIVRPLGKGGMGSVYLAQNTQAFDRLCVIKEMAAYYEPGKEQEAQARFEQEARTLAALKHPGVPDIYGFFSDRGHHYIVMEYLEGETLERGLTRESDAGEKVPGKALDEESAVRYVIEVCRVIEYLASVKPEPVVHCDIKPSNILIDRNSGQAVLIDFGTAKARFMQSLRAGVPQGSRESIYGTVGYAPPELYQGQAESRSDVFSLAATLYHLLTDDDPREHPFKWPAMERFSGGLRMILERALLPDPAQRPTASELRQQLEAYRASLSGTVRPLTFPDGNVATTLTGVLDLAARYWAYTRQILYDGSLDSWLRHTLNDPVAADRAAEAMREYPSLPDAGLDAFVRGLNPRLPPATLAIAPGMVEMGSIQPGEAPTTELTLANQGPGGSHGAIVSSQGWLTVSPATFGLGPGEELKIDVRVLASDHLPTGSAQTATISARPVAGQPAAVDVRVVVATPVAAPSGHAPAKARPAAPQPPPSAPRTGVTRPKPAAPPAKKGSRRVALGLILLGLGVVIAVALALTYIIPLGPRRVNVIGGLSALAAGDYARMGRDLAGLDAADGASVALVGQALDETMVTLPGASFTMGRDDGAPEERPAHEVSVAGFAIDRFEVTNVQYQRFVDVTLHAAPAGWAGGRYATGTALQPVTGVTWEDASVYAAWLGKRLPTEAEWELAARGTAGRLYPWGDDVDPTQANFRSSKLSPSGPANVGSFPGDRTPEGVLDMGGNVREWTRDKYQPYPGGDAPRLTSEEYAIRRGSWRTYSDVASARDGAPATTSADDLGFRCVR